MWANISPLSATKALGFHLDPHEIPRQDGDCGTSTREHCKEQGELSRLPWAGRQWLNF